MEISIQKSDKPLNKYKAISDGKTIHFGSAPHSDYLQHQDDERKEGYLKRHKQHENWQDPLTAGFYSRWLLWNKNTLEESIDDMNKRFNNIHVKLK